MMTENNEQIERMAEEIERLKTPACVVTDNICPIDTMNCEISALKCEISRLKAELEKYKKESRPMKTKDPNSIGTECPDGVIRECCYDEETHKFLPPENKTAVTNEACSVCVALKEKIEYWKKQFDLEVVGRRKAEAELEKRPEVVFCKDCRAMQKGDQIDPERLTCVHGAIVEPYDFCSMGQRRESEEGK